MNVKDTCDWRPVIFLAVLMSHVVIVLIIVRTARQTISSPKSAYGPLLVMFYHDKVPPIVKDVKLRTAVSSAHTATLKQVPDNAITVPPDVPPQPKIDWEHEAELAAQSGVANLTDTAECLFYGSTIIAHWSL